MMTTVTDRLKRILVENFDVNDARMTPKSSLADMGLDSLDKVEVVMCIEEEFDIEITDAEMEDVQSYGDLLTLSEKKQEPVHDHV